jgi:hypothetical protein
MSAILLVTLMKLYNGFCYTNLNKVRNTILSSPFLGDGSVITSVTKQPPDLIIQTDTGRTITITPPDCNNPGDYKISFADSGTLAWLVASVLVTAFAIKSLKRGL